MNKLLFPLILMICPSLLVAQDNVAEAPESFTITGVVLDEQGDAVANSVVIPLSEFGIPLERERVQPLTMQSIQRKFNDNEDYVLHTTTDIEGKFNLQLPLGKYRLVAQSWLDKREIKRVLDDNGSRLRVDGVAEVEFDNEMEASEIVEIRPLGQASAKVSSQEASDMLLVSANPLAGDPALGFMALTGDFWPGLLAGTAMERKDILISGLPPGDVQFFSFVNDNNGGMGGTLATLAEGQTTDVYVGVIAGWSNGHRTPPPALEDLTNYFLEDKDEATRLDQTVRELQQKYMPEGEDRSMETMMEASRKMVVHLDDEYELMNGEKVTLGEAMAARNYARMKK